MNSWRLIASIGLGVVLVGLELESWVLLLGLFFIAWKISIEFFHLKKPSRWLINTMVILFVAILAVRYRSIASQEASSSFLILLASLKLLEERTLRDQKFLFLLGFVLISALFLFSLEIPALVGGIASFIILWSAQNQNTKISSVFIKSLPLTLFLFLFFPRVQNPFGLQGLTSNQGSTGFSDELNPGSISKIQDSKTVAFRVQFTTQSPRKYSAQDQYWRGQVLTFSDGLRWTKPQTLPLERVFEKIASTDYEVTLEPQGKRWLFTWEPTSSIQTQRVPFVLKKGSYFESVAPIYERLTYQGKIGLLNSAISTGEKASDKLDLQTSSASPQILELVRNINQGVTHRKDIADKILTFYRTQKFTYTKNPGTQSSTLEDFILKGKKGYCEHYAASFAVLMRLAGVPTRVVTGYQGGMYNTYGNFWKFTQADAHAWTEYLNEQGQWMRVDPTEVVAPERLELGGTMFEDLPEEWIGQNRTQDFLKNRQTWWIQARESILQNMESWNYDLVLFLIDFNLEKQKEIFQEYRLWVIGLGIFLLALFVFQSFYRRDKKTFAEWLLQEMEKKAQDANLYRKPHETLRHFTHHWIQKHPEHQQALKELLLCYESSQYTTNTPKLSQKQVQALLKTLRQ